MLKIRYNTMSRQLSGWTDREAEFDSQIARKGERTALLDIPKPDADDYEYFIYKNGKLVFSGKQPPTPRRDPLAEIDELRAEIEKLKQAMDATSHR